jgi:hypothetical protein
MLSRWLQPLSHPLVLLLSLLSVSGRYKEEAEAIEAIQVPFLFE